MASIATSAATIADSASSQLIGLMFNWGLFGLLVAQVFTYHTIFLNDRLAHKVLVHVVFALETVQTVLLSYDRYITFVRRFGQPLATRAIRMSWFTIPILCGIIGFIAQVFYAHRIYKISKSKALGIAVLVLSMVQLVAGLAEGVITHQLKFFFQLKSQESLIMASIWILSTVICDILIAVSMTCLLLRFSRDFHYASSPISKLILLSVETGTATASVAIIAGILFLTRPRSQSFNIPAYILGKLYANSLMRVLNSRVKIGNGYSEPFPAMTPELTTAPMSHNHVSMSMQQPRPSPGEEHILDNPDSGYVGKEVA